MAQDMSNSDLMSIGQVSLRVSGRYGHNRRFFLSRPVLVLDSVVVASMQCLGMHVLITGSICLFPAALCLARLWAAGLPPLPLCLWPDLLPRAPDSSSTQVQLGSGR
jgi:hypothetical protein